MDLVLSLVALVVFAGLAYFIVIARKPDVPPPVQDVRPAQPAPTPTPTPTPSEPVPGPNLPPNPTVTDILFGQSDETKRILDERARQFREQNGSDGFTPVTPWPAVWEPRRFRCRMEAGVVYRTSAPDGRGWAVVVTTNGNHNARFEGAAGTGAFFAVNGVIEAVTDTTTEVWLDPR